MSNIVARERGNSYLQSKAQARDSLQFLEGHMNLHLLLLQIYVMLSSGMLTPIVVGYVHSLLCS